MQSGTKASMTIRNKVSAESFSGDISMRHAPGSVCFLIEHLLFQCTTLVIIFSICEEGGLVTTDNAYLMCLWQQDLAFEMAAWAIGPGRQAC